MENLLARSLSKKLEIYAFFSIILAVLFLVFLFSGLTQSTHTVSLFYFIITALFFLVLLYLLLRLFKLNQLLDNLNKLPANIKLYELSQSALVFESLLNIKGFKSFEEVAFNKDEIDKIINENFIILSKLKKPILFILKTNHKDAFKVDIVRGFVCKNNSPRQEKYLFQKLQANKALGIRSNLIIKN
jgi:hypothetical protein